MFGDPQDLEGDGFEDAREFVTKTAGIRRGGLGLYGPHNPGTRMCGGVIARGAQGQFPDRFCLKTECCFTTHATKSYLPKMVAGGTMSSRLSGDASQVISNLRGELADAKSKREALESTVLTLSAAVGSVGSIAQSVLDQRLKLHDEAVNRRLDTIPQ